LFDGPRSCPFTHGRSKWIVQRPSFFFLLFDRSRKALKKKKKNPTGEGVFRAKFDSIRSVASAE